MKQITRHLPLAAIVMSSLLVSCQKEQNPIAQDQEPPGTITTQVDDESRVSAELDAVSTDAVALLESDASVSGDNAVLEQPICDATIAWNTTSDPITVTVTYNGTGCAAARTRSGIVVISMAKTSHWKDTGAQVTIDYQHLKIARTRDGKHFEINGKKTYTNVSGGLLRNLATDGPIIHHTTSAGLSVSFDDGTARDWQIAREKIFTYDNGIVITVNGLHTEGNVTGIADWGANRGGKAFTTVIDSSLIIRQDCNFRLTSGVLSHAVAGYTAKATFGLDASGAISACPSQYYYKLDVFLLNVNMFSQLIAY